jgi:hypothetical protein
MKKGLSTIVYYGLLVTNMVTRGPLSEVQGGGTL